MNAHKTLLIDACNTTLLYKNKETKEISVENLEQNKELLNFITSIPLRKIVVTNANKNIIQQSLHGYNYEVFSLDGKPNKVEPEFYSKLLIQYNLKASDCYYFDSKQENLDAAKQAGIHGALYKNNNQIISYLQSLDLI